MDHVTVGFRVLSEEDAESVRLWRNADLSVLRTPFPLTREQQQEWYRSVVCNRDARARWWGVHDAVPTPWILVGYAGLERIEWENRRAEVSLLISPPASSVGFGRLAVAELLRKARDELNLASVWGEVYECGPVGFWQKALPPNTVWAKVPMAKWWGGRFWDSMIFTVPLGAVG